MKRILLSLFTLSLSTAVWTSCGDGIECPSDIIVTISSPGNASTVTGDSDPDLPGIQANVEVQSTLKEGDVVTLTIGTNILTATADAAGNATFANVTLDVGVVVLTVRGTSACGTDDDIATVTVVGDASCELAIQETPLNIPSFPLPVLNTLNDSNLADDFQANIDVTTTAGYSVELFLIDTDVSATPQSLGTISADDSGLASFARTLTQGQKSLFAVCSSTTGASAGSSVPQLVFVDTEAPTCSIVSPTPGTVLAPIPGLDTDNDPSNGAQIEFTGKADAGGDADVQGEMAQFIFGSLILPGTDLDANGESTATATFNAPGAIVVEFQGQDKAGNLCSIVENYTYDASGCSIDFISVNGFSPVTTVVTSESDAAAGFQLDFIVDIGTDCAGEDLTITCTPTGGTPIIMTETVPGDGRTSLQMTGCATGQCERDFNCLAEVTSPEGNETSQSATITVDNQPPAVVLIAVDPSSLPCGQIVVDTDPGTSGIQRDITVQNGSGGSVVNPMIEHTYATGLGKNCKDNDADPDVDCFVASFGQNVTLTLQDGQNDIAATVEDLNGNRGIGSCTITFADIAVTVGPPVSDGIAGIADGNIVAGPALEFNLCGTVDPPGADVEVTIGANVYNTTTASNGWCVLVTELEGTHTVNVVATAGSNAGILDLPLEIDITPPDAPSGLTISPLTRESARLEWTGTSPDTFMIRYDVVPLASDADFDTDTATSQRITVPAADTSHVVTQLRSGRGVDPTFFGTAYYFAIAAVDLAGNRSLAHGGATGNVVDFDASGPIVGDNPGDADDKYFGYAMAHGFFNDDAYSDVAIAAPFVGIFEGVVYVFLGTANGIRTVPNYIIRNSQPVVSVLGRGLTAIHWNNDGSCPNAPGDECHDLAVGAPFQNSFHGNVYIFSGGSLFADPGTDDQTSVFDSAAHTTITAASVDAGWFAGGFIGWSLATTRFDSDGLEDLLIGVAGAKNPDSEGGTVASGGAAVVYGGNGLNGTIGLSSVDGSQMNGAVAHYLPFPLETVDPGSEEDGNDTFGHRVFNLGRLSSNATTDAIAVVASADQVMADADVPPVTGPHPRGPGEGRDAVYVWRSPGSLPGSGPAVSLDFDITRDLAIQASNATNDDMTVNPDGTSFESSYFGDSVGTISDRNNDQVRDIVVAAMRDGSSDEGTVYIVDGSRVGVYQTDFVFPSSDPFTLLSISGSISEPRFGSMIVNNADSMLGADVNADGEEDLVIVGGAVQNIKMYVWYGDTLPTNTGSTTVTLNHTSADHTVLAPPEFLGEVSESFVSPTVAIWAGDTNGDSLEDMCWSMHADGNDPPEYDGVIEFLDDDGI